jgi:hypothetical protein
VFCFDVAVIVIVPETWDVELSTAVNTPSPLIEQLKRPPPLVLTRLYDQTTS